MGGYAPSHLVGETGAGYVNHSSVIDHGKGQEVSTNVVDKSKTIKEERVRNTSQFSELTQLFRNQNTLQDTFEQFYNNEMLQSQNDKKKKI